MLADDTIRRSKQTSGFPACDADRLVGRRIASIREKTLLICPVCDTFNRTFLEAVGQFNLWHRCLDPLRWDVFVDQTGAWRTSILPRDIWLSII